MAHAALAQESSRLFCVNLGKQVPTSRYSFFMEEQAAVHTAWHLPCVPLEWG